MKSQFHDPSAKLGSGLQVVGAGLVAFLSGLGAAGLPDGGRRACAGSGAAGEAPGPRPHEPCHPETATMKPSLPAIGPPWPGRGAVAWLGAALLVLGLAACSSTGGSGSERGGEGSEVGEGGGEESNAQYGPADIFWMTRKGVRLDLRYDAGAGRFIGTATNITGATIRNVRVEVHVPNDPATRADNVELGPTPTRDLAAGETLEVELPAAVGTFVRTSAAWGNLWGAHAESDGPLRRAAFTPSFGPWAVVEGVDLGIEHPVHRMSAWYASRGVTWTPHLVPDPAPEHQPAGDATWTGEWAGYHGSDPAIATGAATVTVTLGTGVTEADLALEDVPTLGTLQWNGMPVRDGRFTGGTTASDSQAYDATGQFGGAGRAGVVGHASGPAFRSVFHGEKD